MNKYELAVVLKPDMDEEAIKNLKINFIEKLEKSNCTIEKIDNWGRRKLAYEINKYTEGVYVFINFSAEPQIPSKLESKLRISENILRYLIIRQED